MKNSVKKSLKASNGITLIALVITIIVLLILAGVSIAMLSGENSILNRATQAKAKSEEAAAKEQIQMEVLGSYATDNLTLDKAKLVENLGKIGTQVTGTDFPLTVTLDGQTFSVDSNGNVTPSDGTTPVVKTAKFADGLSGKTHAAGFQNITAVERATGVQADGYMIDANKVSTDDSDYPIYMWSKDNILYWYSEAEKPILPANSSSIFGGFSNLENVNGIKDWDISNVDSLSEFFGGCWHLTSLDLSNWNVGNVTNMHGVFDGCSGLVDINLSGWNTSNVTIMDRMFMQCFKLANLDISSFDTTKVVNTQEMFNMSSSTRKCSTLTNN